MIGERVGGDAEVDRDRGRARAREAGCRVGDGLDGTDE
jgi:hypothetical protein